MPNNKQHYQLWTPHSNNGPRDKNRASADRGSRNYLKEEADFFRVRNSRLCAQELIDCQQMPPHRSLVELINSTLVVGQEVSLAVILLAVHREIVTYEEGGIPGNISQNALEHIAETIAMALLYASMLIIAYYNQKGLSADSEDVNTADYDGERAVQHKHKTCKKGHRRKKAMVLRTPSCHTTRDLGIIAFVNNFILH